MKSDAICKYNDSRGIEVTLTPAIIRKVIAQNDRVTDVEVKLFLELCKSQKLNPFIREAYLVKYGDGPASLVVGKDVHMKRAQRNPRYRGSKAGIFVMRNGKGKEREGSMVLPDEQVVGGWAKVYVEGYETPIYDSVAFDEYAGRKRNGELNQQWASKPGTMIRKVALVHALREAFPEDLGGLYDSSEMGLGELPDEPIEVTAIDSEQEPVGQDDELARAVVAEAEELAADGYVADIGDYYDEDQEF